jgi:hypothetical protein
MERRQRGVRWRVTREQDTPSVWHGIYHLNNHAPAGFVITQNVAIASRFDNLPTSLASGNVKVVGCLFNK